MSDEKIWLLDGTNWSNWRFRMEVLLEHKGLLSCVEEPLDLEAYAVLVTDTADQKRTKQAERADRIARDRSCRNLLVNRIAEDQLDHVKDVRTAKETWDALREAFERVGIAAKLFLKKKFQELRLAEGGDVQAFLLEFEKVLRELKAAGVKMEKEDVVCQLLLALPRSFDALITAVETIEPADLTLEYVKKRVKDEQVKRDAQGASDSGEGVSGESAFAGKRRGVMRCFGCGRPGHKRADCPDGPYGWSDEKDPGKDEKSWSSKSNRRQTGGANVTGETPIAFGVATGNASAFSTPVAADQEIEWILDSGATDHMVHDKSLFDELRPLSRKVQIAVAKSGQSLVAESVGTVKVKMLVKGKLKEAVVNNVLYVPELQCNLFSVRRVEDIGMSVKIAGGKVIIEKRGRIVGSGRRSGQFYVLNVLRDGKSAREQFQRGGGRGSCRDGCGGMDRGGRWNYPDDQERREQGGPRSPHGERCEGRNVSLVPVMVERSCSRKAASLLCQLRWKEQTVDVTVYERGGSNRKTDRANKEKGFAKDQVDEHESTTVVTSSGGEEKHGSSGQQSAVKLTEDEDAGALPSHCLAEGFTRRSERERRTTDTTVIADETVIAGETVLAGETVMGYALNAETEKLVQQQPDKIGSVNRNEACQVDKGFWDRRGEPADHSVDEMDEAWIVRLSGGVGWQPANQQARGNKRVEIATTDQQRPWKSK